MQLLGTTRAQWQCSESMSSSLYTVTPRDRDDDESENIPILISSKAWWSDQAEL
jgi:hypothetical protein